MAITVNPNLNLDSRRYNDVTRTDVAVIFSGVDGEPPYDRNTVAFSKNNNQMRIINTYDSSLDPLAYPLLFPNGDFGFHLNMRHNLPSNSRARAPRTAITMTQYASYRLAIRDEFSILHRSQKLFLQWVVDMYVRVEGNRLHYIRTHQNELRTEVYSNLTDFLNENPNNDAPIGRRIILPSSFSGSPRNMFQHYLDAMSIVQHHGKPSLFMTLTCNPEWPEIVQCLEPGEQAHFRPDIVVRVFKAKLDELIKSLLTTQILGKINALIYTIEFQKRGLPHAHILITFAEEDKIETEAIDKYVCAEIPDIETQPQLHNLVKRHMMHGPCGAMNPNNVCMKDGNCKKNCPKDFCEETRDSAIGYPIYRRRDNGVSVDVRNHSLDNPFVVPYNPYLLAKFNCHINVEVCTSVRSVKYIYKYVYKGYDCATIELGTNANDNNVQPEINEINNFVSGRYVGSTEAAWRIFQFQMHFQSHTIIRLDCHLPQQQQVYFVQGQEEQAAANPRRTKLLAFFELNQADPAANSLIYTEVPSHYVWIDAEKRWQRRQRGGDKIISRLYVVNPKNIELFHMRLLLLHVRGPKSFQDLRLYEGIVHPTFLDACHARGIASNDNEWRECLNEAKETKSPRQLRELFGYICGLNFPSNALELWNEFKLFMCEDFMRNSDENTALNHALLVIEDILSTHNLSCRQLNLPIPVNPINLQVNEDAIDIVSEGNSFDEMYFQANQEQQRVIDRVLEEVQHHNTGSNVFCLTAHAGCGKTFVQKAIIHKLNSLNLRCIPTAFSGIASTLLQGGRTMHNVFKLPVPILEDSVSSITANSADGRLLMSASLIIIDEVSMCPLNALKLIDRLLKDLCQNETDLFGGKTILLCGDFRQILPVVPHGSRATLIENCITSWHEFSNFHHVTLMQNMRALSDEIEFVEFLKSLGNGHLQRFTQFSRDTIQIPPHLIANTENIVEDVFGNIAESISSPQILDSAILAPKNDDCFQINNDILNRMPGNEKVYYSHDKVICDNEQEQNNYPTEFLNSLNVSGLPPHKLVLKQECIVLLIRNLNTKKALVNGTRMRVKRLHNNSIDCEVLNGVNAGKRVLIPRIHLTYSGTILPFSFRRTQFPIICAFAMTINKSQGQTFRKVAILLKEPVFSHGQLYVAASRVRSFEGLRFYISDTLKQGHLSDSDDKVFTKNIVYSEVLLDQ